jgi:cyclic pyranopterin phosphate synthase
MLHLANLSHFDAEGNAIMVDVSHKEETERVATAEALVFVQPTTMKLIVDGGIRKGDVVSVAQLAGIMGAKRTPDLIPLCHPLSLSSVSVSLNCDTARSCVHVTATCRVTARTGVEMEALTAAAVASLTIYDMCKAVDRGIRITDLRLVHKSGGKSGTFNAS